MGRPTGVSPSLASAMADALGVPVELVAFEGPGEVVDALSANLLDVGNVGSDPQRERDIAFSDPYCEIEATYLVRSDSPIDSVRELDRPGIRIAAKARAAFTLWLDQNIESAEVIHTDSLEGAAGLFAAGDADALAGLRPGLLDDARRIGDCRVLDGGFTSVTQAVGIHRSRDTSGIAYLNAFVGWAVASGLVARLIEEFAVSGLTVPGSQPE